MEKTDLLDTVATQAELTKGDAKKAVDALFETISNTLAKEEKIQVVGFGTFDVRERAARTGRTHKQEKKYKLRLPKFLLLNQVRN
ncbi:HU family DNA-binding protein [Peribacillus butanolivorans]|uniref:HU family DNA-binding protein n=1 Tax=Peribacillus butanolivorans TaxID=421767 RepID=UPI0036BC37EE